ncbi:PREDICTED: uncharacterized protein LOC109192724 [Ipomoea nil]|uniref:uncharacterized protein LOC109192724 n=1 Tax=Ipomoea nil TaxID=35883 RepID=UPI000901409B|nr:PREDICTED: uncharacterized protein LOC109192724 [Ipomoea nil]
MKVVSWNCRGVGNFRVRKHVKQLLNSSRPDALCLLEIRTNKVEAMIKLANQLGFSNHFLVEPLGFAGGLLLLWNHMKLNLDVVSHSSQAIHTRARLGLRDCFLTFAYVKPNIMAKSRFWDECRIFKDSVNASWVLVGDLNDIAAVGEQWGSDSVSTISMNRFSDAMNNCSLFDVGASGPRFTWCRHVGGRVTQMRKLDRVLWNMEAQMLFPEAKAVVLARLHSDHHPVLFIDEAGNPPDRSSRPFRFEAAWLGREDYKKIWEDSALLGSEGFANFITLVTAKSKTWNTDVFGNIFQRKRHIEGHIRGTQQANNYAFSGALQSLDKRLQKDLNEVLDQEETFWFQKSRVPVQGSSELAQVDSSQRISNLQALSLTHSASMEEVRKAVFGMKRFGPALTTMVNQALASSTVQNSLLTAYVTLIPKKEAPESAADFRPITLLNVAFKVISKVLVNRLRPIMCKLIGPHQNSFLPGRSTLDNIILTQEIVHVMNKKKGHKGSMAVKVDLQKAYDSVDWAFLEDTLVAFGFPRQIIDLILFSLRESRISILWNGGSLEPFKPGRGLRQGDPLAPYLFNLVMERLAYDIQNQVSLGHWRPISISRGGVGISHLFFADDLMLFGEASDRQAKVMIDCLNRLGNISGLKVNHSKSQIFCSPNTGAGSKQNVGSTMGIPVAHHLGSYLGIPLLQKRVSKDMFGSVLNKMRQKLANWKANSLSMAGRRVLVQSSLATIPTYSMQSMALPSSTCKDIDKICRNFLWGHSESSRKIHTVNWGDICKSKGLGGLGLRTAKEFNLAFLAKLAWQMVTCPNKLWVKALHEKYVKDANFLTLPVKATASPGWKGILKGRYILANGMKWKVGTGDSINFWEDWWVGDAPINNGTDIVIPDDMKDMRVNTLISGDKAWDLSTVRELLPNHVMENIRATPIAVVEQQQDTLMWPYSGTGLFTIKSGYNFITGYDDDEGDFGWLWRIKCAEKIKIFLWKVLRNGLLTNSERTRRGLTDDDRCPRCDEPDETLDHIFRRCDFANACWSTCKKAPSFNGAAATPLHRWIKENCTMTGNGARKGSWNTDFVYILWNMRKARNDLVFNHNFVQANVAVHRAVLEAGEAERVLVSHRGIMLGRQLWIGWSPPMQGWTKLNTDGARKANTGMASAGGVIRDHTGAWLVGFSTKVGTTSSFMAELWGLREGLLIANNRGLVRLVAEVDSISVVNAIKGDSTSRPEANTLISDCKSLMTRLGSCDLRHTLREGNSCADFMANLGQNSSWGTTVFLHPPDEINNLLRMDANGVSTRRIY